MKGPRHSPPAAVPPTGRAGWPYPGIVPRRPLWAIDAALMPFALDPATPPPALNPPTNPPPPLPPSFTPLPLANLAPLPPGLKASPPGAGNIIRIGGLACGGGLLSSRALSPPSSRPELEEER